jgi:hypothetical protein
VIFVTCIPESNLLEYNWLQYFWREVQKPHFGPECLSPRVLHQPLKHQSCQWLKYNSCFDVMRRAWYCWVGLGPRFDS